MKTRSLLIAGLALYLWNRYARRRPVEAPRARLPASTECREQELDQELDGTFPASDPLSITRPPTVTRWKIRR